MLDPITSCTYLSLCSNPIPFCLIDLCQPLSTFEHIYVKPYHFCTYLPVFEANHFVSYRSILDPIKFCTYLCSKPITFCHIDLCQTLSIFVHIYLSMFKANHFLSYRSMLDHITFCTSSTSLCSISITFCYQPRLDPITFCTYLSLYVRNQSLFVISIYVRPNKFLYISISLWSKPIAFCHIDLCQIYLSLFVHMYISISLCLKPITFYIFSYV